MSERCDSIITILEDAQLLEAGMSDWGQQDQFRRRRVSPTSFPYNTPLPESFTLTARFYFPSQDVVNLWLRYYLARMKLHESLIDGLMFLSQWQVLPAPRDYSTLVSTSEEVIRWAADSFLGATAFALGEVSSEGKVWWSDKPRYDWGNGLPELDCQIAIRLLMPLQDLRHSAYIAALQREAIEGLFMRISHEMRLPWAIAPDSVLDSITSSD